MAKRRWTLRGALSCGVCLLLALPMRSDGAAVAAQKPAAAQANLLLFGDWGENTPGQRKVAAAMAQYAARADRPIAAVLSVGDNFYMQLSGEQDPLWTTVFEQMYDPARLAMPFYMAMGNHDYEGNNAALEAGYARSHPRTRWRMPSRWYRLDFPAGKPLVTFLVTDSNKPSMGRADWEKQTQWLEAELNAPRPSAWTVVIGHHPLFSNGLHTDIDILQEDWGGILKKHKVDFYICGHDHSLQHLQIENWPTTFLITGGGGASLSAMIREDRGPFSRAVFGFAHMQISAEQVEVRFIGDSGQVLHDFVRRRDGTVQVLQTTGHDKPLNALWRTAAEVREKASSIKWMIPTTQGANPWGGD